MTPVDPFRLATSIATVLESLGIRYVIGGSVASSMYGEPRSTLDLDIMIEVDEAKVLALVDRLRADFYVDDEDALEAVRRHLSFNAIEFSSAVKVDFFVAEDEDFARCQLDRRRGIEVGGTTLYFYAPEDILIRKLLWFRLGNEQSDRQWRDIVGLMTATGTRLDLEYVRRTADELGLGELLKRATGR